MEDIVIWGTGGFGKEIMDSLHRKNIKTNQYNILGFIDDLSVDLKTNINGYKIIGNTQYLKQYTKNLSVLICVGNPFLRKYIYDKLRCNKYIKFPNYLAPEVQYNDDMLDIGYGNIVSYNNILTSNIRIGNFNIINMNCILGHGVVVGDFNTISPTTTLLGDSKIEDFNDVGAGTIIRQGLSIGNNSIIGMGSVVVKNIQDNVIAFGNPCIVQKENIVHKTEFKEIEKMCICKSMALTPPPPKNQTTSTDF